jgi:hypothetical protein
LHPSDHDTGASLSSLRQLVCHLWRSTWCLPTCQAAKTLRLQEWAWFRPEKTTNNKRQLKIKEHQWEHRTSKNKNTREGQSVGQSTMFSQSVSPVHPGPWS